MRIEIYSVKELDDLYKDKYSLYSKEDKERYFKVLSKYNFQKVAVGKNIYGSDKFKYFIDVDTVEQLFKLSEELDEEIIIGAEYGMVQYIEIYDNYRE